MVGVYWGAYRIHNPAVITGSLRRLFAWFEDGALRPMISETSAARTCRASDARGLLGREAQGKIVLTTAV